MNFSDRLRILKVAMVLSSLLLMLTACNKTSFAGTASETSSVKKHEVLVAAAASLSVPMSKIDALYSAGHPEIDLVMTYGSSGALQAQIEEGSPIDVFISAASKQVEALEAKDLILDGSVRNVLANELVLIVPATQTQTDYDFAGLIDFRVERLAIGDPSSVPAGAYSDQVFTTLGIRDRIASKLIFATDVRQVLTWVEGGEVDAGLVYASDASQSAGVRVTAVAPAGSHLPIVYPAAVIRKSTKPDQAQTFIDYLTGQEAQAIFSSCGFIVQ